jgi:hypothetical protein
VKKDGAVNGEGLLIVFELNEEEDDDDDDDDDDDACLLQLS